ncbi:MAG: PAS domain S-box protein [Fibrobacteria bacterium]|nr:PAS domain S-box protein [Fibrobacteria bacterium]
MNDRLRTRAAVAGGVGLFLSAILCQFLSKLGGDDSFLWPSDAIVLVLCLRLPEVGVRNWVLIFSAANLGSHLLLEPNLPNALGSTLSHLLFVLASLPIEGMLRERKPDSRFVASLILLGALSLVPLPLAAMVATTVHWMVSGADWVSGFFAWMVSNLMGLCLVLLPGLNVKGKDWKKIRSWAFFSMASRVVLVVVPLSFVVLKWIPFPFVYLALVLVMVSIRFGPMAMTLVAMANVLVLGGASFAHWVDFPFGQQPSEAVWLASVSTFLISWSMGGALVRLREQAEFQKRVESKFNGLLDSAATGYALLDREGRILEVNRSFLAFLGIPRERVVGHDFREWIDTSERGTGETGAFPIVSGGVVAKAVDLRFRGVNGVQQFGRTEITPLEGESGTYLAQVEDVTASLQAERDLRHGKAVLQTVIDNLPGLVAYWDSGLRNRFANRAYWDWYGLECDEIEGLAMREVIGDVQFEILRPEIAIVLEGRARFFEKEFMTPGGIRFLMVTFIPDLQDGVVQGFYSFVSDVTQLRQAQKAQLDTLARLRGIIDGATEFSIIATNTTGSIELFSVGAEKLLGFSAAEVVGKFSAAALHDPEELVVRSREVLAEKGRIVNGFEVLVDSARRGISDSREWTYISRDGKRIPVQLVVTALHDHDGRIDGFLGIARDISREKDVLRAMAEAKFQAERASQLKGEFVANMSHEIRTPMNAVLGMAQLLETTNLSPNQKRYLDMIQKSGKSLLGILDDILDFSKIEAGKLRIDPVELALDTVLENVANICAVAAQGKELDLSIIVDPEVPTDLMGDPLRLQQVLVNLVGNAVKFTAKGHVSIHVDLLERNAQGVEIGFKVEDSGIGMNDEQLRRIFHPFSQADGSMTRRFGGTGLGLAISKRLTEMMGGRMGVHSKLGTGTEFFVSLPFPVRAFPSPPAEEDSVHLLVLEPASRVRRSLEWGAARYGWRTTVVESLEEGLEYLRTGPDRMDLSLILVDGGIPGWKDREGIANLRAALEREIPVVKLAGFRGDMAQDRQFRLLDGILVKPVVPSALRKLVDDVLGEESENGAPGDSSADAFLHPLAKVKVLLVEDNAFNQVVATETLRNLGAEVELAENGKVAVERLAAGSDYHIVLMDVQMPVMDGYTATRQIRQQLGLALPILAMTAGVLPSDRDRCLESGMDDFLTKPFQVETLVAVIREHLTRSGFTPPPSSVEPLSDGSSPPPPDPVVQESSPGVVEGVFEPGKMIDMLGMGDGSAALVRKLVGQFLDLTPKTLSTGREAIEAGDQGEAVRAYHNLKSTSASLGASALSQAARSMEAHLNEHGFAGADVPRSQVEHEFGRVEVLARRWLES